MTHVKVAAPVYTLGATLTAVDTKTAGKTLQDLEANALVGTFLDTLTEVVPKRNAETLTCAQAKTPR